MIDLSLEKYSDKSLQYLRENIKAFTDDGELWWSSFQWNRVHVDRPIGSRGSDGYPEFNICISGKTYRYKCHVVIWAMHYGSWPKGHIDHVNGIRDDSRISNLRLVSDSENLMNSTKTRGTSKYRGVCFYKAYNKWSASIQKEGNIYFLGYFDEEIDAHAAYRKKAEELYGEYYRGV